MKKLLKQILVFVLLVCNLFVCTLPVSARKAEIKRNIAIVFDNSGTMYYKGEKAWCRATYAMEVFASMMNKGDSLSIHPMNPIEVNGNKYLELSNLRYNEFTFCYFRSITSIANTKYLHKEC